MKLNLMLITGVLAAACGSAANAAVTAEEAARLGKDLTPWGAEMAGNKEGTIPAYTGGQSTPPPGFDPNGGGKRWIDPYAGEKPRLVVTAANMEQYADKLPASAKEFFKRFPKTFRMDIYPTHRSVWVPEWVNKETAKNATSAKILPNGYGVTGVFSGIPFPIPKSGSEVWWNRELRYKGLYHNNNVTGWMMDASGRKSLNASVNGHMYFPIYDQEIGREKFISGDGLYYKVSSDFTAPAGRVGETYLFWTWLDNDRHKAAGWAYTPGTRRVRTSPDLFYDTPSPAYNGGITMDDMTLTYGPQDRFDWKLVGKKEMFVPYNNYTQQFKTPSGHILTQNHPNPDDMRWELHRMWVIEGTPKQGIRHIYSSKILYQDEDMGSGMMETFDHAGKLFRGGWDTTVQLYDLGIPYTFGNFFFDFSTGTYWLGSHPADPTVKGLLFPKDNIWRKAVMPMYTPEYLQANGIR